MIDKIFVYICRVSVSKVLLTVHSGVGAFWCASTLAFQAFFPSFLMVF